MSFQEDITKRVAVLTERLNEIAANAKRIFELPVQNTLVPTSKIHVDNNGTSQSLEVQMIIDAVAASKFDQLISIGDITIDGNEVTVPANAVWKISDVFYSNLSDVVIEIILAETGYTRTDILVANTSNDIVLVSGLETSGISVRPNIPPNTVLVTEISVSDSSVGEPTVPVTGDDYVKKAEAGTRTSSDNSVIDFGSSFTRIDLTEATDLHYIAFDDNPYLYNGKPFWIFNKNVDELDLTIHNLSGGTTGRFSIPSGNLVLRYGEGTPFKLAMPSMILDHVGIIRNQIGDIEGLEAELALKLDASAYNDRFKGKYTSLSNLESAHPTANDGDYAIVDAGSGTDAIEYLWDADEGWVQGGSVGATTTDALPEGSTNLYWTTARGLALVLSGLSASSGTFTSSDTLLTAFGKIKYLIDNIATTYQAILTDVNFGAFINGLTGKTTPIDADSISIVDTADSNKQKKVSLTNFKAYLLTWITGLFVIKDRLLENATVSGSFALDYSAYELWNLTLTGTTTFTESNLERKTILIRCTGNFALTFPANWSTDITGIYYGTVQNLIVVQYFKTGVYKVSIIQPN